MSKKVPKHIQQDARKLARACKEEDVNMVLFLEKNREEGDRQQHRFAEMRGNPSPIVRFMHFVSDVGLMPGAIHEYLFALEVDSDSPSTVQVLLRKLLRDDSQ